jgi:SAM-dependent methyltransferase
MTVLTATEWPTNAHLIRDVAQLGYLGANDLVLDCTYGLGNFWTLWRPARLIGSDINPDKTQLASGEPVDFTDMPWSDETFDAVVMDPPYKLNGTPTDDDRYGVDKKVTWRGRHALIHRGIRECARVLHPGGHFLLKCMDQVCSGQKRWQTREFTSSAERRGLTLVDRFDMLTRPRPQPSGRRQVHTQGNYSTLLVFRKPKPGRTTTE